jgi:hypothetical protein
MANVDPSELNQQIQAAGADLEFLRSARDTILTHPKFSMPRSEAEAAIGRLIAVSAISAVEKVLKAWRGEAFIAHYSDDKKSNHDRVRLLSQGFRDTGVTVDDDVMNDFLAMKYLRNTLVHLGWDKDHQRQFVEQRGFPSDISRLHVWPG